jgi:hypothetical protein
MGALLPSGCALGEWLGSGGSCRPRPISERPILVDSVEKRSLAVVAKS